jgi:hypothetical protein
VSDDEIDEALADAGGQGPERSLLRHGIGRSDIFVGSKHQLLFKHKGDETAIPRGLPFALESLPLPK